jgi:hypothetical protein
MSINGLRTRLRKLIGDRVDPEHCPGGITLVLSYKSGEPKPAVPADAYGCKRCGQPHVLILEERIVMTQDDRRAPRPES